MSEDRAKYHTRSSGRSKERPGPAESLISKDELRAKVEQHLLTLIHHERKLRLASTLTPYHQAELLTRLSQISIAVLVATRTGIGNYFRLLTHMRDEPRESELAVPIFHTLESSFNGLVKAINEDCAKVDTMPEKVRVECELTQKYVNNATNDIYRIFREDAEIDEA